MSWSRTLPDASTLVEPPPEQVLPGSLGDDDHGVIAGVDPPLEGGQESTSPWSANGNSGINTKFASWLARVAMQAM